MLRTSLHPATRQRWTCAGRAYISTNSVPQVISRSKLLPWLGAITVGASLLFFYPSERYLHRYDDLRPAQSKFLTSQVIESRSSGLDTKLITLKAPPGFKENFGSIWSVFIKYDDIQIERPYTPLEGVNSNGNMSFWIKRYEHGEVGRWLHSKRPGDSIEVRGPLQTWKWEGDKWDAVVMISGGTGITPFYQLFHKVIAPGLSQKTRFTLLHSSPGVEHLPPETILAPLKSYEAKAPKRFRLHLFVDVAPSLSAPINVGRIDKKRIEAAVGLKKSFWQRLPFSSQPEKRNILFLVCGPEPMVAALAGPYGRNYSQGMIGGALKELGFSSDNVYKL